MPEILPGGPAPEVPGQPIQDPSQLPLDPSQAPPVAPLVGQPVSEEKRQILLDLIATIREKLSSLGATKFAGDSKTESLRSELLQQVFEKLQLAGVNLEDRNSVAAFIERLKQNSPELAANFEKAMETLLGGVGMPEAPQDSNVPIDLGVPQQNMNNENQNEQTIQDLPQG